MVHVAERVWSERQRLSELDNKPFISLLLSSPIDPTDAREAVDEAFEEVAAELAHAWESAHPPVDLGLGGVSTAVVPKGVMVEIGGGTEDFDGLLNLVVHALDRRGVVGRFDVFHEVGVEDPPNMAPLVECRMRVLGERYHFRGSHYRWRPDQDAWLDLVKMAVNWALASGGQSSMRVENMPRVALQPDAEAGRLVLDSFAGDELAVTDCATKVDGRWRMAAVQQWRYRISLIELGEPLQPDGWSDALRGMTGFLHVNSHLLLYALIKHGCRVNHARSGESLAYDWPPRAGFDPVGGGGLEFEDSYAPDAFAAQLLGPRYAGRIPGGSDWRRVEVGNDRIMLEHINPAAWFETPFPPQNGRDDERPPPRVLVRARDDFSKILFMDSLAEA